MQRILIIQDVGLWIDLNRELTGVASVDLVEAMSFETGQLLAQLEHPQIIVYGVDADGPGPVEFRKSLDEEGLGHILVVGVRRNDAGDPKPTRGVGSSLIECSRSALAGVVREVLDASREQAGLDVEILAHYESLSGDDVQRSGFAVVLELTERRLVFEADQSLECGDALAVNFFVPDRSNDSQRVKVAFECTVAQCRDEMKLVYSASISKMGEASREAVRRFASGRASEEAR